VEYVRLGTSGLTVSRLALGCMSYGNPGWRPWVLDEAAAQPFFKRAIDAGINFFDTADMYSLGVSEEVTGRALRAMARREELVIATKVNFPMSARPNMGGLSRKHILQACDASLRRLGVEAIDLYQIHRFDSVVPIEETLEALNDLVRAGKVRYLGASSGPSWRMAQSKTTTTKPEVFTCAGLRYSTMVKISRYPESTSGTNFWYHARQSSLPMMRWPSVSKAARLS
jgi:aryl-alcohol dehydrogenase-like predicted oxidoreductase